jgi:cellulose synthase/poly-beta-1,6-N-acetylglucosamine synthase-like glycosyltransferase
MLLYQNLLIYIIKFLASAGIIIYAILLLIFFLAWIFKKRFINPDLQPTSFVSLIISIRNEEENLHQLFQSLECLSYPEELFEILLVDDHSTDSGLKSIQQFADVHKHVHSLMLPDGIEGKKSAIRYGLKFARGEIILTTDADCRHDPEWISTMVAFQQETGACLIIAPVVYADHRSIFKKIQALEFSSLILSGASSALIGTPILCNGANIAFLKSVYPMNNQMLELNTPSGDDIFLLLYLKKRLRKSIHFLKSQKSIIYTNPCRTFSEFINQRKRWYSKSIHYTDPEILGCGLIISLANLGILLSLILAIALPLNWNFFYVLFLIKFIADITFIYPYLNFIQARHLIWLSPILEILYPFYIIYIMVATKISKFRWKEREYGKS